eukprot:scaffold686_cov245-Skeletonema_marinoi.AAC.31
MMSPLISVFTTIDTERSSSEAKELLTWLQGNGPRTTDQDRILEESLAFSFYACMLASEVASLASKLAANDALLAQVGLLSFAHGLAMWSTPLCLLGGCAHKKDLTLSVTHNKHEQTN